MIKKIDIKRELSEEEFKEIIFQCESDFLQGNNLPSIASKYAEVAKEITPAKEAHLLLVKLKEQVFQSVTGEMTIPMQPEKESILMETYRSKQSLLINDVTRSFLYNKEIDNFLNLPLKDMMLIPIIDESKKKNVVAVLWTAITSGSWNQYTQKDLDYMTRFAMFTKRFLLNQNPKSAEEIMGLNVEERTKACDHLRKKIQREQQYFSSIIHDIRTPMNAVMGFLELLNLIETDQEKKDYLDTAIRSGKSMVTLINDALDLAKMASGQMKVEKRPFNPLQELDDTAKLFFQTAQRKGVSFSVYFDPHLPEKIVSDPHRIKQIINNLLSNAVKFTPKGGMISLQLHYEQAIDGLHVSVKDSGIGIDPERQKEIFTPFVQEKESTSREFGGTGLGLSISQQLVVLLGGKLQLESEPGEGSRFFFNIPCNCEPDTPSSIDLQSYQDRKVLIYQGDSAPYFMQDVHRYLEQTDLKLTVLESSKPEDLKTEDYDLLIIPKEDSTLHREALQTLVDQGKALLVVGDTFLNLGCQFEGRVERVNMPLLPHEIFPKLSRLFGLTDSKELSKRDLMDSVKFPGKKILVVDDNLINLKFMKEVLKQIDLDVFTAQNGEECLEKLRTEKVDLIFMDENMPEMQGSEVIREIKDSKKLSGKSKEAAIISLTGDAGSQIREYILQAGADDVLTKPVQLQEIVTVVRRYLS